MILVDTSVWVDHLKRGNEALKRLLHGQRVASHPFVVGEVALGSLARRAEVLSALQNLPQARVASTQEVLDFTDANALHGMGIGYVDAHLLAAARLTPGTSLWTLDKRLTAAAQRLGLAAAFLH